MLGSQDEPGVMYRTMKELFKRMDDAKEEKEFAVAFSYLEVNILILSIFLFCYLFQYLSRILNWEWLSAAVIFFGYMMEYLTLHMIIFV